MSKNWGGGSKNYQKMAYFDYKHCVFSGVELLHCFCGCVLECAVILCGNEVVEWRAVALLLLGRCMPGTLAQVSRRIKEPRPPHIASGFFFFYLPPACSVQDQPWGRGRCHPFCRSRSHLEEADDTGTPPAVTEAGFERMILVLREMCLTHLTTTAHRIIVEVASGFLLLHCENPQSYERRRANPQTGLTCRKIKDVKRQEKLVQTLAKKYDK